MNPGGAIACNVVDTLPSTGPLGRVQSAMAPSFGDLWLVPVLTPSNHHSSLGRRNVVIVASV